MNINIFDQDNSDWKKFAEDLLWQQCVYEKNEYSGYDIICRASNKMWGNEPYPRGNKPGDIVKDTRFLSYYIGPVRELTWKELTLALGFFKDGLLNDGHNCKKCPERNKCNAYFKDNEEQECCRWWKQNMPVRDVEERYNEFIEKLIGEEPIEIEKEEIETGV